MRSTYLDTELMLVIDSEKLNQQIHETESDYMEKSKEVLANGQETEGAKYQKKVLNWKKRLYYGVLRIVIRPLRQLLWSVSEKSFPQPARPTLRKLQGLHEKIKLI